MQISRVEVVHFRALRNSSLNFSDATAILGENNCGKSAFLQAIDLFFSSSPRIKDRDYSDGDTSLPIDITLHFDKLTPYDREEFQNNLLDEELVVTRRFVYNNQNENGKYFISARVNAAFNKCSNELTKNTKRSLYNELRETYTDLPKEKNADEIDAYLEDWETAHPDDLSVEKVRIVQGMDERGCGKVKAENELRPH